MGKFVANMRSHVQRPKEKPRNFKKSSLINETHATFHLKVQFRNQNQNQNKKNVILSGIIEKIERRTFPKAFC